MITGLQQWKIHENPDGPASNMAPLHYHQVAKHKKIHRSIGFASQLADADAMLLKTSLAGQCQTLKPLSQPF